MSEEIFWLLTIGGASLVPLSIFLQSHWAKEAGTHASYRKHLVVRYVDWLLMPFLGASVTLVQPLVVLLLLPVGLIVSHYGHRQYASNELFKPSAQHFFTSDYQHLSKAGYVHHGFSVVVMALFGGLLLSPLTISLHSSIALGSFAVFALASIGASLMIHKRIILFDWLNACLILILIIVKYWWCLGCFHW